MGVWGGRRLNEYTLKLSVIEAMQGDHMNSMADRMTTGKRKQGHHRLERNQACHERLLNYATEARPGKTKLDHRSEKLPRASAISSLVLET